MIRTQVYLTQKQHALLKKKAHEKNTTFSEELRNLINVAFEVTQKKQKRQNAGNWLRAMVEEAEKLGGGGPPDLASNVDKYLYGGK